MDKLYKIVKIVFVCSLTLVCVSTLYKESRDFFKGKDEYYKIKVKFNEIKDIPFSTVVEYNGLSCGFLESKYAIGDTLVAVLKINRPMKMAANSQIELTDYGSFSSIRITSHTPIDSTYMVKNNVYYGTYDKRFTVKKTVEDQLDSILITLKEMKDKFKK